VKHTIIWSPEAEEELASLWVAFEDRAAITAAANQLESRLQSDPASQGESRSGNARILFEPPLVVTYRVFGARHVVRILSVRIIPRPKRGGG
jgi:hypothetical protein